MGETLDLLTGFVVFINLIDMASAVQCGSHFTSKEGSLQSPGYPKPYPPDQYCVWTISVQGSAPQIQLKFSSFDLQPPSNNQCNDYVLVYQGMLQQTDKQIAKYCGSAVPSDLLVKKTSVRIEFVSNSDGKRGKGFMASFYANSNSAITTSQATAGIVAAIFCGIVFVGVGAMRCVMLGACQRCEPANHSHRECIGSNDTMREYGMDSPPDYITVMAHPDLYPTSSASQNPTPISTPGTSRVLTVRNAGASVSLHSDNDDGGDDDDDDDEEGLPPYPGIVGAEVIDPTNYIVSTDRVERHCSEFSVPVQINDSRGRRSGSHDSNIHGNHPYESNDENREEAEVTVVTDDGRNSSARSTTEDPVRENGTPRLSLDSVEVHISEKHAACADGTGCNSTNSSEDGHPSCSGHSMRNHSITEGDDTSQRDQEMDVSPYRLEASGSSSEITRHNSDVDRGSTGARDRRLQSNASSEPNVVTILNSSTSLNVWL